MLHVAACIFKSVHTRRHGVHVDTMREHQYVCSSNAFIRAQLWLGHAGLTHALVCTSSDTVRSSGSDILGIIALLAQLVSEVSET